MSYKELLEILKKNSIRIIRSTAIAVLAAFVILYFVFPVSYRANVTVLPPESKTNMGGLGSLLGTQDFSSLLTGTFSNATSQLYIEILKSRSAAEYVVQKHNLVEYYNVDTKLEAVKELQDALYIELSKEGIITLNVETKTSALPLIFGDIDSTKKLSAALANSYIEALDMINRDKLASKARQAREYIEVQLTNTKTQLDSVEKRLMLFQTSNKAISLPEQVNAAIEAAANLKSEIVKTEIELGMMRSNLREDNKTLIALQSKLEELRAQYNKLELGSQDYLVAFKEVPELGMELASLLREVKIQNEVYLMLQQQYYKEKIQENRDIPTVEVLDEAIPPLKASGPRVVFISLLIGIGIFMLVSFLSVLRERKITPGNK